jgi:hypothetical protein
MSDSATGDRVSGIVSGSSCKPRTIRQSKLQFIKVIDGRKQPIRGLWKRGEVYYVRLAVRQANGALRDKRIPLKSRTLAAAQRQLKWFKSDPRIEGAIIQSNNKARHQIPERMEAPSPGPEQATAVPGDGFLSCP